MNDLVKNPDVKDASGLVKSLRNQAESLKIVDDQTDLRAKQILTEVTQAKKKLEDLRKEFVRPFNEGVKNINSFFKERILPADETIGVIKNKVGVYFREKAIAAEKERKRQEILAAKRQETADKKAQKEGTIASAVPVPTMPEPEKTTRTQGGSVTTRKVWKFQVNDVSRVPDEYKIVDERKIRQAVSSGIRDIPGVVIYQDEEVAVR